MKEEEKKHATEGKEGKELFACVVRGRWTNNGCHICAPDNNLARL